MRPPYDPFGPIVRDPRSKRSREATIASMAAIVQLWIGRRGECDDEDLLRAGFSAGEIDACRGDAMAIVRGRAPSPAKPAQAKPDQAKRDDTILDMAAFLSLTAAESIDGNVTRADLQRAGFTAAEIEACRAAAVVEAGRRSKPRQITRVAA